MKIIFHNPMPLNYESTSASGIRPIRMMEAFKALGYEVALVAGYGAERSAAIEKIKSDIAAGAKYQFCYSESSTQPTLLTEKHHFPLYPMLDFSFLSLLKRNNIPIGLFYRDIYWVFEEYNNSISFFKAFVAKIFYKYDLVRYNNIVTHLYLPSIKMARYVPIIMQDLILASPPGLLSRKEDAINSIDNSINQISLLYVGGMSHFYEMHELFKALPVDGVRMTLCTRESDWSIVRDGYPAPSTSSIDIVHKSGDNLKDLYDVADIGMLFVKPDEYWAFSEPFKLYEYLGCYKPIIASEGTLAAQFVKENKVGWVIPYSSKALKELLMYLRDNPEEITYAKLRCRSVALKHTWIERAKKIASDLSFAKV